MSTANFALHVVEDVAGTPTEQCPTVPKVALTLWPDPNPAFPDGRLHAVTDDFGRFVFNTAPTGLWNCKCQKDGWFDIEVPVTRPGPDVWIRLKRNVPAVVVPHLEIRGNDFVDASGQPVCLSCCDMFPAFRMFLDGRMADLEALAAESHEFGFQWWRVFMMGSIAQNTIFSLSPSEPAFYSNMRPFADWCNAHGIGLLAEVYVDNQDVRADVPGHWNQMAALLRGSTTILSGGNEAAKNGFDPQALTNPGMVWTRGSGLADQVTPQNGASCASFHQRTDYPKTLDDAVASRSFMRENGYTVLLMDEPTRFDENSNKSGVPDSPRLAFELARVYGGLWNLACFHNYYGQRGLLMGPNVRAVASAWQRGMKA